MSSSFRSAFRHQPRRADSVTQSKSNGAKESTEKSDPKRNQSTKSDGRESSLGKSSSGTVTSVDKSRSASRKSHLTKSTTTPTVHTRSVATKSSTVSQPSSIRSAPTATPPGARHDGIQSKFPQRTHSVASGSTASTMDGPKSNGLRRKPSSIEKYAAQRKGEMAAIEAEWSTTDRRSVDSFEAIENAVLGTVPPPTTFHDSKINLAPHMITSRIVTPPIQIYAPSATPSTRYTDSPFSHIATPSSASSYSTGITALSGTTPHPMSTSPMSSRATTSVPKITNVEHPKQGLTPVRESSQSSSNSTVKPSEKRVSSAAKESSRQVSSASPASKTSVSRKPGPNKSSAEKSRRTSVQVSVTKPAPKIPPELAHLNVDPPKITTQKSLPPTRPSREGTPNLSSLQEPPLTVQSDLPRVYTTWHKRTPSQDTPGSASSAASPTKSRFAISSRSSSRNQSPRIDSAISPGPSTATRGADRASRPVLKRRDSPAVGPAPSPTKSPRFGFFSRKPKTETSKVLQKPKREHRRGPAAGTGHEGYGRFGFKGRSSSTTSVSSIGGSSTTSSISNLVRPRINRNSSRASSNSSSELDDFLSERLTPIVLRGSGSTASYGADSSDVPQSSNSSSRDRDSKLQLVPSASQSERSISPIRRLVGYRRPSDSSEDDVNARYPTISTGRSIPRLQNGTESLVRASTHLRTNGMDERAPVGASNSDVPTFPKTSHGISLQSGTELRNGLNRWSQQSDVQPPVKSSNKWNFLQRARSSPRKGKDRIVEKSAKSDSTQQPRMTRQNTHYAMEDAVEPVELSEVERIVMENPTSGDESSSDARVSLQPERYSRMSSVLLPSPVKHHSGHFGSKDADFRAKPTPPRIQVAQDTAQREPEQVTRNAVTAEHSGEVPGVTAIQDSRRSMIPGSSPEIEQAPTTPELSQGISQTTNGLLITSSPRQPRLSPVGRIPAVVSRRDRDRKLPDNSFSRPFARTQPKPNVRPPGGLYSSIRDLASPIEGGSQPVSSTSGGSGSAGAEQKSATFTEHPSISTNRTSMNVHQSAGEFLGHRPKHNSEQSYYSSDSQNPSWLAPNFAPPQLFEDEVWKEYDDFLDDVMPQDTPISASSSLGAPFQYTSFLFDNSPALPLAHAFDQVPSQMLQRNTLELSRSCAVPGILSVPQQIALHLQPSLSPLTPNTISDFVGTYQDRTSNFFTHSGRQSYSTNGISQLGVRASMSSRYSQSSRRTSLPEIGSRTSQQSIIQNSRSKDIQLVDIAEYDGSPKVPPPSLRFAALMASKLLCSGRILFSPAHNEMRLADKPQVLVVDGTGCDWSHYVALTYPEATVYSLGPSDAIGYAEGLPSDKWKPLANHRQVTHDGIGSTFPFPRGFFTAVVLRFPVANTEKAYHSCIYECKRVLRPGGHLEVTVVDIDLAYMGTRTRRAVRGLKTRMQERDQSVSLRNLSDVLVSHITRRGFEDVKRCAVGVAAAGQISRSQDMSSTTSSDGTGTRKPRWRRENRVEKKYSFSDLVDDPRMTGPVDPNDENMVRVVPKVGRWWYSLCYEAAILPMDQSIWKDRGLLRECERQGTCFQLLFCHAQKPVQSRRRTMSV